MSVKRKDCKGRILRTGESQRKDGRYVYKYLDYDGKQQFLYSWHLEERDKIPNGKPAEPSLREKIRRLKADLEEGIRSTGDDMTVLELVQKYIRQKTGVRHNTIANYNFVLNIIKTPHVCRHTYCSNMAKSGMNPNTLQYLMGHSDIGITLNTYTHLQYEDVEAECLKVSKGK